MHHRPSRKILFLFGAGASISAGVPSTGRLTDALLDAVDTDEFLKEQESWLRSLWKAIQVHAPQPPMVGHFTANFEHLINAVELLENFTDVLLTFRDDQVAAIKEFGRAAAFRNDFEAYAASSFALLPMILYARTVDPATLSFQVKGASARFMWAARALHKVLADQFPPENNLDYLESLAPMFRSLSDDIVVATTNYDLVLDEFMNLHGIPFDDGFDRTSLPCAWKGFQNRRPGILYLKLHGSLGWFEIRKGWFENQPKRVSPNGVYKVGDRSTRALLKPSLIEKMSKSRKALLELDVPCLIAGGGKDSKILRTPYVELHLAWMTQLATASTLVFVGVGGSDLHLLRQTMGLVCTNSSLEKVLIVDPGAPEGLKAYIERGCGPDVGLFHIESEWGLSKIEGLYKLRFDEMLAMSAQDLRDHCARLGYSSGSP